MSDLQEHYRILRRPHLTEKSTVLQDLNNQYTFLVHPDANKVQIRRAIEAVFNVKVTAVNTLNRKGKASRLGFRVGRRQGFKKAVVTLKEGQAIELAT